MVPSRASLPVPALLLLSACGGGSSASPPVPLSTFRPGFSLRQDVQLGSGSVSKALVLDLDGDGPDDFVEADLEDHALRAATGNDDGSFFLSFQLPTPGRPWDLVSGDLDGDGHTDLAVACLAGPGVAPSLLVYRGLSPVAFAATGVLPLPADPFDLAVGRPPGAAGDQLFVTLPDVRETWRVELVGGALEVRESIAPSAPFDFAPISVAAVDFDGDGALDLVLGEMRIPEVAPDRVSTSSWNGTGFAPPAPLADAVYPLVAPAGDADGDGYQDVAVAQLASELALLLRGSPGGLAPPLAIAFGGGSSTLVFEDLDGDGLRDVAAALFIDDAVTVRLADGPLSYGPPAIHNVGAGPRSLATGRFGPGGELDLFCSNLRDVSVLHGDGTGAFDGARGYRVGANPQFVRNVDFDGDGDLDAASVDLFQSELVFLRGDGSGGFEDAGAVPLDPTTVETPGYLIVRDFDEDGRLDLATSVNSAGRIQLVRNTGALPPEPPDPDGFIDVGVEPLGLDAGDLDGDGHQDLIVANAGEETLQVLLGQGDGTFAPQPTLSVPYIPLLPVLGDWDLDGALDVALATGNTETGAGTRLLVLAGDGAGGLSLAADDDLPSFTPILQAGDLDEDGLLDLAGSQPRFDASEVQLFFNRGSFLFHRVPLTVGLRMGTLEITDSDLDGRLDLVVPLAPGQLVVALGDGRGAFPTVLPPSGEQFPVPRGASTSAWDDVDMDGRPDLMTISPVHPYLWVSLNRTEEVDDEREGVR